MVLLVKQQDTTPAVLIRDGTYKATVASIKAFSNSYGARVGFEFTINGGPFDGETITRSTTHQLSRQSKLAEVIEGILGRELTDKELHNGFDLEDLVDQNCSILVLQTRSKTGSVYANVDRVFSG